ncbi:hypothetical protein SAMN04487977_103152 [Treponema bryantii]|uniref:Uncharacterized protein n=2 Tax=Treponema bryantii TaxID=163 RepID=A0A1H9EHP5_9SPIR|nr:hypothetical protein SAMN04487977_103152 [Treponema bryantii]
MEDMTDINKFLSDMQKSLKHDRQNNGGKSDYNRVKNDLRRLFERNVAMVGELADSVYEYWENEYIYRSADIKAEPSEENQNRLVAYLAFLENSDEFQELISDADWNEFGRLVNFEAEDLDVDVLQDLMKILVSKGAY